jgi:UDPglucose 6-dehydrogenase
LGYVGLATAICLAKKGHHVIGIDPDMEKVKTVNSGRAPFFEPQFDRYLEDAVRRKTLAATQGPIANTESAIAYITVGTPSKPGGSIDLAYVETAARDVGRALRKSLSYQLVVVKSTVIPGTARKVVRPIIEKESGKRCGKAFGLCSNPEFLREGHAIHDTFRPDRIIIGSEDHEAIRKLEDFYLDFHKPRIPPLIKTTHENAELIKYANNAFLATKVSFINTIASIAERIPRVDVTVVARGIGLDPRVGAEFLNAGLGYGGSCLPKDLAALISLCRSLDYEPELLEAVAVVNRGQLLKAVEWAFRKLKLLRGKRVAILGLAFKPNTNDMRDAVSIRIVRSLLEKGARIVVYDPKALKTAKRIFSGPVEYADSAKECLKDADGAILVTEWEEFKRITPQQFRKLMRNPLVYDGRRIYDPYAMANGGVDFVAIGLADEGHEHWRSLR